jgi:hypothetical protein
MLKQSYPKVHAEYEQASSIHTHFHNLQNIILNQLTF